MKPITYDEVNTNENEIPDEFKDKVENYNSQIICGSIVDWEDPMGIEQRYVGLYDNAFVMFLVDQNFLGEFFIEIPYENIRGYKPSRAKGFSKKNKICEVEIFWELTDRYIDEYNTKKENGEQFLTMDDFRFTASASAVEQMMGLTNTTATLLIGEIKGTGKFNSFGLVVLETLKKINLSNLII